MSSNETNEPLPVIYTSIQQSEKAVEAREALTALTEVLGRYTEIGDPEQRGKALELLARGRKALTEFDNRRKEMGAGARKAVNDLNAEFKQYADPVEKLLRKVEAGINAYNRELEAQRQAEERARREAEDAQRRAAEEERQRQIAENGLEAPPPLPEPPPPPPPAPPVEARMTGSHGSTGQYRDNWKYRVVDISAVPEQFLVPPEDRLQKSVLNSLAKSSKGKAEVPGIEFYNEPVLQTRVG